MGLHTAKPGFKRRYNTLLRRNVVHRDAPLRLRRKFIVEQKPIRHLRHPLEGSILRLEVHIRSPAVTLVSPFHPYPSSTAHETHPKPQNGKNVLIAPIIRRPTRRTRRQPAHIRTRNTRIKRIPPDDLMRMRRAHHTRVHQRIEPLDSKLRAAEAQMVEALAELALRSSREEEDVEQHAVSAVGFSVLLGKDLGRWVWGVLSVGLGMGGAWDVVVVVVNGRWCCGNSVVSTSHCRSLSKTRGNIDLINSPAHTNPHIHTLSLSIHAMALPRLGAMAPLLYAVPGPTWRASWQRRRPGLRRFGRLGGFEGRERDVDCRLL
jgi:hypothetical protein